MSSQNLLPCQIRFYNSICNATEDDNMISFEHSFPPFKLNKLFIRDSYKSIASRIHSGKTIITGTSGIGKSLFLIYLLWKFVKQGKRVLFVYHPDVIYYDGQGGVFELSNLPSVVDHSFWTSDLWCLFDAKGKNEKGLSAFPYDWCTFVLSTTPRADLVNDFKKYNCQIFYMPLWTETELEAIAPWFPTVTDWRNRFNILGGIPQTVLDDTKYEPTKLLRAACRQCEFEECIKIIGLESTVSKAFHSLVHLKSEAPFEESTVSFASQAALDTIAEIKEAEAILKITELFVSCAWNPLSAALLGRIFELYALEMLEKGGEFKCRQLVHDDVEVKPSETVL